RLAGLVPQSERAGGVAGCAALLFELVGPLLLCLLECLGDTSHGRLRLCQPTRMLPPAASHCDGWADPASRGNFMTPARCSCVLFHPVGSTCRSGRTTCSKSS